MEVLYVLLVISFGMAVTGLIAFLWANKSGQFRDLKTPAEKILYDDPQKQFRVDGYRATAQLEAQVTVPSIDFSWKSDPLSASHSNFAIIGNEVNGRYYAPKR